MSEELSEIDEIGCFMPGGNREGEIPEPIPNSEVKPFIANGTARKSVGE